MRTSLVQTDEWLSIKVELEDLIATIRAAVFIEQNQNFRTTLRQPTSQDERSVRDTYLEIHGGIYD